MNDFFESSVYFGVLITLAAYSLGLVLKKKFKFAIFNPILLAVVIIIIFLIITGIDYDIYYSGAQYINFLLTPATVCLAIPLYEQLKLLKENTFAIILGIVSGTITSLLSVLLFSLILKLDHSSYVTLLPKSITTAIGIGISEELGGYIPITVAAIITTGILGNVFAELFCKICKITNPIAKGVAIGTSTHALGTSKAMEIGETEGAISSLSIVIAGIVTVLFSGVFASFI